MSKADIQQLNDMYKPIEQQFVQKQSGQPCVAISTENQCARGLDAYASSRYGSQQRFVQPTAADRKPISECSHLCEAPLPAKTCTASYSYSPTGRHEDASPCMLCNVCLGGFEVECKPKCDKGADGKCVANAAGICKCKKDVGWSSQVNGENVGIGSPTCTPCKPCPGQEIVPGSCVSGPNGSGGTCRDKPICGLSVGATWLASFGPKYVTPPIASKCATGTMNGFIYNIVFPECGICAASCPKGLWSDSGKWSLGSECSPCQTCPGNAQPTGCKSGNGTPGSGSAGDCP